MQTQALLLRAIAKQVAEALGPEGRHASADCDIMADIELLIARARNAEVTIKDVEVEEPLTLAELRRLA